MKKSKIKYTGLIAALLFCGCNLQPEANEITEKTQADTADTNEKFSDKTSLPESEFTEIAITESEFEDAQNFHEISSENIEKEFEPIILKARTQEEIIHAPTFEDKTEIIENEEDFPNKDHLKAAREALFNDEEYSGYIERYNTDMDYQMFPVDPEKFIYVESPDDIAFSQGISYDFDKDGEEESIFELRYEPSSFMSGCAVVYCDEECALLPSGGNPGAGFTVMDYGDFCAVKTDFTYGFSGWASDIYTWDEKGITEAAGTAGSFYICTNEQGGQYFVCDPKYSRINSVLMFTEDGVLRQAAAVKITEKEFTDAVENAALLLAALEERGNKITEIYTTGYRGFWLCSKDGEKDERFYFELADGGKVIDDLEMTGSFPSIDDESRECFTDKNYFYNVNIWQLAE